MGTLTEDGEDFTHLSLSDSDSDHDSADEPLRATPRTTPSSPRTPRSSALKSLRCPYDGCPKSFNRKARLHEHLRSHTNTRIFNCSETGCTKDFLRDSHLKHHIKSAHTNVRDYACSCKGCGKRFATGTRLRRHEAAHQGRKKWTCTGYAGCNEYFRKHDTLKRHILLVHEKRKPFVCTDINSQTGQPCLSAFEMAEKLRAHKRAKHDITKFTCSECLEFANDVIKEEGYEVAEPYFASYADLQNHISTVHPPTCSFCPTKFTTAKELKRHLELLHDIVDPSSSPPSSFPCTYPTCNRTFTKRGNMNVHVKTVHEKRRDFVCGQTPLSLSDLTRAKSFPGSQTTEIEGCGRDFTSKSSLEEHVRTAHLQLGSKRMEREKKRKAERLAASSESEEPKRRKSRKGQGQKHTALSTLTGLPPRPPTSLADSVASVASADELTGSETMFEGQIYGDDHGYGDYVDLALDAEYLPSYSGRDAVDPQPLTGWASMA